MDEIEHRLSQQRLLDVSKTLSDLQEAFSSLEMFNEEQNRNAVEGMMQCALVGLRIMELTHHLSEGKEFYEALRATVRGEMKVPPKFEAEWESALTKLRDPTRHN